MVEGTTPGFWMQMAGMAPLPAVSTVKPHPMFALTRPISGTLPRGAGQTLEASIMNANSSGHGPMQCDAGRTRQAHSDAWAKCAAMSVRGHRPSRNGGHPPPAALQRCRGSTSRAGLSQQQIDLFSLDAWEGALNLAGWPGLGGDGWAERTTSDR